MSNISNRVQAIGNLVSVKPVQSANGNTTVFIKIGAQRQFVNKATGKKDADFIEFKAFIGAAKFEDSIYAKLTVGEKLGLTGSVSCASYEKDGKTVYPDMSLVLDKVGGLAFLESKTSIANREAIKVATAVAEDPEE